MGGMLRSEKPDLGAAVIAPDERGQIKDRARQIANAAGIRHKRWSAWRLRHGARVDFLMVFDPAGEVARIKGKK